MPIITPGYIHDNFVFTGFERSKNKKKKYDAVLFNANTGRYKRVPFGSKIPLYEQYKDTTGLKLYSKLDHGDKNRRRLYRLRHKHTYSKIFSPSYFSYHFLW